MEQLNIVELIETNPITKLSKDYNIKLLSKIKQNFTEFEQQVFLSSFYCYLNCDPINDYVIDLDNVWKWIGFSYKHKAKILLEKFFVINKDYKVSLNHEVKQKNTENVNEKKDNRGGQNKEIIMLNINTFKKFCLKAGTIKADEIHDYYFKLEELLQESINEESSELKKQLTNVTSLVEKEKEELKEKTLLEQFPINTQCVYIGLIDNKTLGKPNSKMYNETVLKFGQSNNLNERVKSHKKTYENFRLYNAFKVKNKRK